MAQINPSLPTNGGENNVWGTHLNTVIAAIIAQGNASDTRLGVLEPPSGSTSGLVPQTTGSGQAVSWLPLPAYTPVSVPAATTTTQGLIKLAGVLAGTADNPTLATVGSSAAIGTFGSSTQIPIITRDAFGRVTNVTTVAAQASGTLSNPMTATGDLIVGGAAGAPTRLIGSLLAAKRFLAATGTGTAASAPTWGTIDVSDVNGASALQSSYVGVNTQAGATYTAGAGDIGKLILMSATTANTFVFPLNSVAAIAVGAWIEVAQYGVGATSFGFATGVTLRTTGGILTVAGQYRRVRATKIATNEWMLEGSFATATTGGGATGGTGGGTVVTSTNLLSDTATQNASDISKFTTAAGALSLDTAISKSGGSALKFTPDGSGAYGYVLSSVATAAPVTAGSTYTAFASVRMDAAISAAFQCYIAWYNASGTQLGIGNANSSVTGVSGNFLQVASTGVAPSGATAAIVIVEYGAASAALIAANTIHVDEFGINAGTSTTWTSGATSPGTVTPASITDTGFTYSGTWNAVTSGTSEHYASTTGASASATFTLTAPGTFSLKGKLDSSNGTLSIATDGGSAVTVSESGTTTDLATIWTSGTLTTGTHTVVATIASPEGSIQGATITNGTFAAPGTSTSGGGTNTGGTGTGTSGTNTTVNSNIIGGPASSSNPSGYLPPTLDAFPGYTNILVQDFGTNFAEGKANGISVLGSGWFSYEGQVNGNYSGMNWDADQISATGSVVTMRNTNAGSNCQALAVMYTDAANVGKIHKQQAMPFGKTLIRMKARGSVGYKIAFLMWPTSDNWNDGEIDFPEGDTVSPNPASVPYTMTAASHNVTGSPADDIYKDAGDVLGKKAVIDDGLWHTFKMDWDSTKIVFQMDGTVINTITDTSFIPQKPMRWVLQCEPTKGSENNAANYIDIDWVAAYKKG